MEIEDVHLAELRWMFDALKDAEQKRLTQIECLMTRELVFHINLMLDLACDAYELWMIPDGYAQRLIRRLTYRDGYKNSDAFLREFFRRHSTIAYNEAINA